MCWYGYFVCRDVLNDPDLYYIYIILSPSLQEYNFKFVGDLKIDTAPIRNLCRLTLFENEFLIKWKRSILTCWHNVVPNVWICCLPHHSTQILVDFENGDIYINWYLLDAMYWIRLIHFQWYCLLTWLPICETKQNCEIAYVLKKTDQNIVVGWLASVYEYYLLMCFVCPGRTWVQKGIGTNLNL